MQSFMWLYRGRLCTTCVLCVCACAFCVHMKILCYTLHPWHLAGILWFHSCFHFIVFRPFGLFHVWNRQYFDCRISIREHCTLYTVHTQFCSFAISLYFCLRCRLNLHKRQIWKWELFGIRMEIECKWEYLRLLSFWWR